MRAVAGVCILLAAALGPAMAGECPGHPDALGTSRVLPISPDEFSRIGSMQYKRSLPLADHEVVITFDDGPLPPYSNIVLDTLASQCVKATYFLVGQMAQAYPAIVRRMYNEGHTIGTHSLDHPLVFQRLALAGVEREVDGGIALVDTAIGDPKAVAPFFRIPGLGRSAVDESFLASHSLVTWSADVVADDWFRHISAQQIVKRRCGGWTQRAAASCCCTTSTPPPRWRCRRCSRSSKAAAFMWCKWCRRASGPPRCPN